MVKFRVASGADNQVTILLTVFQIVALYHICQLPQDATPIVTLFSTNTINQGGIWRGQGGQLPSNILGFFCNQNPPWDPWWSKSI